MSLPALENVYIAVIGLGYVGLPLAVHFARHFPVVGFDVKRQRVEELKKGVDRTGEVSAEEMSLAAGIKYSASTSDLGPANFFIVTVPTPIDRAKRPDLTALEMASKTVGQVITRGGVVVYESTVYPGATEEVCVPIIERISGLKYNVDFHAGYSPERINPGDQSHRVPNIVKITSGSTPAAADLVDAVYRRVVIAGTHRVSSIRVAEAAKIIENIQRDVNIALINELAQLFKKMGLETQEVLEAAQSKWNFHPYQPGLVGGHCIGVDPYYLTHKAQSIGFHPEMILAGRRINDGMASFVANDILKTLVQHKVRVDTARVLIIGLSFKENCGDVRNTKVADLVSDLEAFVREVKVFDPRADPEDAAREYGIYLLQQFPCQKFEAVVLAVRHDEVVALGEKRLRELVVDGGVLYDLKRVVPTTASDGRI